MIGVVDTGATRLVLPKSVVEELGLPPGGDVGVKYADGRKATRPVAASAHLSYAGRGSVFDAVIEPKRKDALIGAIVLEALDLIVDCTQQKLVPRDPERPIAELE
ncbi:MAG: aspartyl protease family protein [Phycisphaerales bacterium]|nr:aspartyl protease family protein [Phycisphaerales bacterium]